jgi:hypothetical protein
MTGKKWRPSNVIEMMRWLSWFFLLRSCISLQDEDAMLRESDSIAAAAILAIEKEWSLQEYPIFLQSVKMRKRGWERMKNRFEKKILEGLKFGHSNFIAGFLGSSVTAGHDSLFSQSFPILIESTMNSSTSVLNVNFIAKNLAIGNNPCMPYDVCPLTFVGPDADLVHWEQTYNCGFGNSRMILETFIRQSLAIPSCPIILFTDSSTPNWHEKDCANISIPLELSQHERHLYEMSRNLSGIQHIAIDLNKDVIRRVHSPFSLGL